MGVMRCGRRGCREIMCHRRILENDDARYICDGCYAQLLETRKEWRKGITRDEMIGAMKEFIRTVPGSHQPLTDDEAEEEFRRLVRED